MADTNRHPSAVESLSTALAQAGQTYDIFRIILKVLEEHEHALYACREDLKMARATSASSDRRCSEALLAIGDLRKEIQKIQANR